MNLAELCLRYGVRPQRVYLWERAGLIQSGRRPDGGRAYYLVPADFNPPPGEAFRPDLTAVATEKETIAAREQAA